MHGPRRARVRAPLNGVSGLYVSQRACSIRIDSSRRVSCQTSGGGFAVVRNGTARLLILANNSVGRNDSGIDGSFSSARTPQPSRHGAPLTSYSTRPGHYRSLTGSWNTLDFFATVRSDAFTARPRYSVVYCGARTHSVYVLVFVVGKSQRMSPFF